MENLRKEIEALRKEKKKLQKDIEDLTKDKEELEQFFKKKLEEEIGKFTEYK